MAFDINNNYTGNMFGQDRIGFTTPDLEFSGYINPFLPVAYPAPYLPGLRQDQGHPKLANIVLTSQQLVGVDSSGAIVPAGLFCGSQPRLGLCTITEVAASGTQVTFTGTNNYVAGDIVVVTIATAETALSGTYTVVSATSSAFVVASTAASLTTTAVTGSSKLATQGQFCIIVYGPNDVNFSYNPQTGSVVTAAGQYVVLAAPSDAVAGYVVQLPNGSSITLVSGDITFALSCNIFNGGVVRPIGVTMRNVYQYLGGVTVVSNSGGMVYQLNSTNPTGFAVNNYMHEMGTAIQTQYVLKVPWIGTTPYALTADATAAGLTGYRQGQGLTFSHFTGTPLNGGSVVASSLAGDYGNYTAFNSATNTAGDIVGRVIGVMNMINRIGFSNRVRTLWDPSRLVGPMQDPNPASIMMGGSSTAGLDYTLNLTTDGIYAASIKQGKAIYPEYGTYVLVRVNL